MLHMTYESYYDIMRSKAAAMCICRRDNADVVCSNKMCSFTGFGRVRKCCPMHPKDTFLLDLASCPWCSSTCEEVVKNPIEAAGARLITEGSMTAIKNKGFRPPLNHASRPMPRPHPLFKLTSQSQNPNHK